MAKIVKISGNGVLIQNDVEEGAMLELPQIYAIKITRDVPQNLFTQLCAGLTRERQKKIGKFRNSKDKQRSLLGELLLRQLIDQYSKSKKEEVVFKSNEYGKPFLVGMPDFHFNISHAGEWIVCAIDCMPVGVDVEQIQEIDMDIEEIAQKTFSEMEYQALLDIPIPKRKASFFELWTLKESYIKAVGKGLSIDLDPFSLQIQQDGRIIFRTKDRAAKWCFKQYEIDKGYKLALCRGRNEFPEKVHIWDSEIFLNKLAET